MGMKRLGIHGLGSLALRIALSIVGPVAAYAAATKVPAASVDVVLTKGSLTIKVVAPLNALVSFNRRPQSPSEQAELDKAMTTLKSPSLVFETPTAAGCQLQLVSLESATTERSLQDEGSGGMMGSPSPTAPQPDGTGGNIVANYSASCEKPASLDAITSPWFQIFPLTKSVRAKATRDGAGTRTMVLAPADRMTIPLEGPRPAAPSAAKKKGGG